MSDKYKVKVTPHAFGQLKETADYISEVLMEPQTAHQWLNAMKQKIQSLESMPNRIRLVQEEPWHARGIHCMTAMRYNFYFWVDEEIKTVWIAAVLSERRDQQEQLKRMKTE